jgi:hypothetical protein
VHVARVDRLVEPQCAALALDQVELPVAKGEPRAAKVECRWSLDLR